METIVKNQSTAANAIIDKYLNWAKTQRWYGVNINNLYKKLGLKLATGFNNRQKLLDEVLLPEQSNRCCYCMRRIVDHNDDATIEHIVPQSTTTSEGMNFFFSVRSGGLNATNVCLSQDFINNGSTPPPYPHHVAYHNFVVACEKCNSGRSNHKISPLFLFDGIQREVIYDKFTGKAEWQRDPAYTNPSPVLPTLDQAGVNRPILKAIRVLWLYVKRNNLNLSKETRSNLIYAAIGESLAFNSAMNDDDFKAYFDLDTDEMWNLFLKYDYFG